MLYNNTGGKRLCLSGCRRQGRVNSKNIQHYPRSGPRCPWEGSGMQMHENRYIDLLLKLVYLALAAAGIYLFFKYVFGWTIPLIIAYLLSRVIIRPVDLLHQRFKIPRKAATLLCTLLAVTLFGSLLYFILSRLMEEAYLLMQDLPRYADALAERFGQLNQTVTGFLARFHLDFLDPAFFSLEGLVSQIKPPSIELTKILSTVGSAASSVPTILITLIFILLGTYFLCSENRHIFDFLAYQLGDQVTELARKLRSLLYNSVGKWLRAQCILICITFCELCVGFTILKLPYAGLLALLIAFIDALPILGVGTVLIPWSLISLLMGSPRRAITLAIIYLVILLVRNSIEPRIVGAQLGLDPFVTLLCIYFGYRIAGFAGMFIVPVVVLTLIKLQEWGYIHIGRGGSPRQK